MDWAGLDRFRGPDWEVLVAGFRVLDSKHMAQDPPTNFTVRAELDWAFHGLNSHGLRGGLDWMG